RRQLALPDGCNGAAFHGEPVRIHGGAAAGEHAFCAIDVPFDLGAYRGAPRHRDKSDDQRHGCCSASNVHDRPPIPPAAGIVGRRAKKGSNGRTGGRKFWIKGGLRTTDLRLREPRAATVFADHVLRAQPSSAFLQYSTHLAISAMGSAPGTLYSN